MTEQEEHTQRVHERIQKRLKEKRDKRANQSEPKWQQPRYDEVFEAGLDWLESFAQMNEENE